MSLPDEVEKAFHLWLTFDNDPNSRRTVQKLRDLAVSGHASSEQASKHLTGMLLPRIAFGTAGLRSVMSPGFACMNDVIICQTAQGIAKVIVAQLPEPLWRENGIVIGFDGRCNSRRWAAISTKVMISFGIKVHLAPCVVPTPIVAFTVRHLGLAAGIMITASHNPRKDNGYKVYWSNGAQIVSPLDADIAKAIVEDLDYFSRISKDDPLLYVADTDLTHVISENLVEEQNINEKRAIVALHDLWNEPLVNMHFSGIKNAYISTLVDSDFNGKALIASLPETPVVYTAMHGVGKHMVLRAFRHFGLPEPYSVREQEYPDSEFPSALFPNPEEGADALRRAVVAANKCDRDVILANDPDADRLAIAERKSRDADTFRIFNGNETGAMLGDWFWRVYRHNRPGEFGERLLMLCGTEYRKML